MGYHITYSPQTAHKFPTKERKKHSLAWVLAGAVLLVLVAGGWKWLLPGNPQKTEAALTSLAEDVKAGNSMGEAITAFCLEIMENGE